MYEWSYNVVALFPDLVVCKPLVFSERLSSPGVHAQMQSNPKSKLAMFKDVVQVTCTNITDSYSGFGAWGRPKSEVCELQVTWRKMANPSGQLVLGEEEARIAEERYQVFEAQLQALL